MKINHNISLDRELYPQYNHHYNFILCHKPFEDRFGDVANKIYITDNEEYSKQSGAILIDNKGLDSRVFGEIPFWGWIAQQLRDQDSASLCAYRRKIYARPRNPSSTTNSITDDFVRPDGILSFTGIECSLL